MTEAEWDACTDPRAMITFLGDRVSRRKLRWFACDCCRRLCGYVKDEEFREALVRAERYADGLLADGTADRWFFRACRGMEAARPIWKLGAYAAVACAVLPRQQAWFRGSQYTAVVWVHHQVAHAVADRTANRRGKRTWRPAFRAALRELAPLLRDIVGDPFHPAPFDPVWLARGDGVVPRLARAAYDNPVLPAGTLDGARLAVLADALEEAGCGDEAILGHLRAPGPHVRGCWVVDRLWGAE